MKAPKICIVSSCGGHLAEARWLLPSYADMSHFFVLNHPIPLVPDMRGRTYFIRHSERDLLLLVNLWEAFRILWKERPTAIFSLGAGPAVPFGLLGRFLFGARVVFIESWCRTAAPSLTGRLMYWIANDFFYQWPALSRFFPCGRLLEIVQL